MNKTALLALWAAQKIFWNIKEKNHSQLDKMCSPVPGVCSCVCTWPSAPCCGPPRPRGCGQKLKTGYWWALGSPAHGQRRSSFLHSGSGAAHVGLRHRKWQTGYQRSTWRESWGRCESLGPHSPAWTRGHPQKTVSGESVFLMVLLEEAQCPQSHNHLQCHKTLPPEILSRWPSYLESHPPPHWVSWGHTPRWSQPRGPLHWTQCVCTRPWQTSSHSRQCSHSSLSSQAWASCSLLSVSAEPSVSTLLCFLKEDEILKF